MTQPPALVSVITPVYNGEAFLAECIESILAQSYSHWEYVIVNNRSSDQSLAIAERYAAHDSRIRVHTNAEFLSMLDNWNASMRQIAPTAKYVKVVHADDWLFPECLERMVNLAEQHPSVGLVGAYRLHGTRVELDGLPYPSSCISGQIACRKALLERLALFGSPTSTLLRADLVRQRDPFYSLTHLHADTSVCYELLRNNDFGFVHQVLTYTRPHEGQMSSFAQRVNSYAIGNISDLLNYGPSYLSAEEQRRSLQRQYDLYYRFLGWSLIRRRDSRFWSYQHEQMRRIGQQIRPLRLAREVVAIGLDLLLNPKRTVEGKLQALSAPRS